MWSRHSCRTLLCEAFTDCIGSGSVIRRLENLDGTRRRHSGKTGSKLSIVIANQILRCLPVWDGFSQLLRDPGISRRSCHPDMDHPSCLELDHEEGEERSKEEIRHLQEVTGPDLPCVVVQERRPLLPYWSWCVNMSHVLLDSSLAHPNAQFQEFSTNTLSAQSRFIAAISLINAMVSAATFGL